jgi:hypothetical protein
LHDIYSVVRQKRAVTFRATWLLLPPLWGGGVALAVTSHLIRRTHISVVMSVHSETVYAIAALLFIGHRFFLRLAGRV